MHDASSSRGSAAWPMVARGQQAERMRRIGIATCSAQSDHESPSSLAAFQDELRKLGWGERNSQVHIRWTAADVGLMERFAKDLVTLQPDLILMSSTAATAIVLR